MQIEWYQSFVVASLAEAANDSSRHCSHFPIHQRLLLPFSLRRSLRACLEREMKKGTDGGVESSFRLRRRSPSYPLITPTSPLNRETKRVVNITIVIRTINLATPGWGFVREKRWRPRGQQSFPSCAKRTSRFPGRSMHARDTRANGALYEQRSLNPRNVRGRDDVRRDNVAINKPVHVYVHVHVHVHVLRCPS